MPAKSKSSRPRRAAKSSSTSKAAPRTPQQDRYVKDLLVRGEAAKLDKNGKLPLAATAVITKENPDGTVEIREVRKKLF
jgi:hypothetical protein